MSNFESTLMHQTEQAYLYTLPNEPRTFRCAFCGEDVPLYDRVKEITDKPVCSDCIGDYCTQRIENDTDLVSSFIEQHKSEFYLSYYLKSLTSDELLELLEKTFKRKEQEEKELNLSRVGWGSDDYGTMKREFCLENDEFFDYLRGA